MKLYKLTLNGWYQGVADKDDLNKLKEHGFTISFVRDFTANKHGEYE